MSKSGLRFDAANDAYVLSTDDRKVLTTVRDQHGWGKAAGKRLYTKSPYAAVALAARDDIDDSQVAEQLSAFRASYDASWADACARQFPHPSDKELDPYQRAGIAYALDHGNTLFGDEMGLGKAQPLSAKVRVPGGWKAIGDLKLGDGLCGYDGKGGRVTAVYDRGAMDVYEVEFTDGSKTRVSADHLWRTKSPNSEWYVAPTWQIAEAIKTRQMYVPVTAPVGGPAGAPLMDPYLLGLLLGDGGLAHGVVISSVDVEILEYCQKQAEKFDCELVHRGGCDWRFSSGVRGRANKLLNRLRRLGVAGHTSHTKFIPPDFLYGSPDTRLALLQGLLDTDGWVSNGVTGYCSVSERLACDVQELVQSLGGIARRSWKGTAWNLTINMPICPFRLDRKAALWAPHPKYKPMRRFKSITYVGREPVRCIAVTCKDRLYITDDYIVTHNTIEMICLANEIQAKRILVVCPASVRLQWEREVRAWSTIRRVQTSVIQKGTDGPNPKANYIFISYDLLRHPGIHAALMRMKFDLFVIDEAHYLKNVQTHRTRAAFGSLDGAVEGIKERAALMVAATGTPLPNRPRECYAVARAFDWEAIDFASERMFQNRYNPSLMTRSGYRYEKVGRLPELRARLRCNFMVRRLKRDVYPQLKRPRLELVHLAAKGSVIKKILKEEARLPDFDPDHLEELDMETRGQISTLRKEMGIAKVPQVVEHVKMVLEGGVHKVFVVAFHRDVLEMLRDRFSSYKAQLIYGGISDRQTHRARSTFVEDPACRVMLGQLEKAGTGLDGLQKVCDWGIFAEADWVPKNNEQVIGRLDRRGLKSNNGAFWQFLVSEGSLDAKILGRAIRKMENIDETLDG